MTITIAGRLDPPTLLLQVVSSSCVRWTRQLSYVEVGERLKTPERGGLLGNFVPGKPELGLSI
ncbi:MAG TPA: hypothetical protein VKM94_21895, partial [Blastocatellia bacterium]|nr:hypothetical protein [Blastocatellia bacterium]